MALAHDPLLVTELRNAQINTYAPPGQGWDQRPRKICRKFNFKGEDALS
jgi:hypothetical protein